MPGDGTIEFAHLSKTNYPEWAIRMEAQLIKLGLWDVVIYETDTDAEDEDKDEEVVGKALAAWKKKRTPKKMAKARAEIVLRVEDSQLPHMQSRDPMEIWQLLARVHIARILPIRLALRRQFIRLVKSADETMAAWVGRVKDVSFKLEAIGVEVTDEDRILILTNGLDDSYETFVISIDTFASERTTPDYVVDRLFNEEARRGNEDTNKIKTEMASQNVLYSRSKPNDAKAASPHHPQRINPDINRSFRNPPSVSSKLPSQLPSVWAKGPPLTASASRGNVGAVKEQDRRLVIVPPSYRTSAEPEFLTVGSSAVTFGPIDNVSAPTSSSLAVVPPIEPEGAAKTLGSADVAASGGKSSRPTLVAPTPLPSASPPAAVTPTAASELKLNIRKLFQKPTSAPPPNTSPATQTSNLSLQSQSSVRHQDQAPPTPELNTEERFNMNSGRSVSVSDPLLGQPALLQQTASQGGPGVPNNRTHNKHSKKRPKSKPGGSQQGHGSGFGNHGQSSNMAMPMEPVALLQATAAKAVRNVDPDSPEIVDRKVKALLNKLTMEKFDSISDQIISWANRSEKERDGRTLLQVIRLVFEKATDEATWPEMCARLCRKMMEKISPSVQDDGIRNSEGKPIAGGQLFRKYLLNRCQEDFERGWVAKEATAAAAATKAMEDQAAKAVNEKNKEGETGDETTPYSDEYYAAQKAERQGLGLIEFIGELFKLQMLTERIMHECVKKLLGNVDNPEEEEIKSLCKLLTTVGALLDVPKARAHMDVYFQRMKELTKSQNVSSRMQFMLQDVIELRERKWVTRNLVAAPTTIHEAAAKGKAAQDKESYQQQTNMSRGGSRRDGDRNDPSQQIGPDGWAVAGNNSGPPRPPPKAGDLSNFGKINKPTPMTFGLTSVFSKGENKQESLSRTSSSSNMFSMLSQGFKVATPDGGPAKGAPEPAPQRKRIVLQPRSKPTDAETAPTPEPEASSDEVQEMSAEEADKKIAEDSKELFAVRNLDEAEVYFTNLPAQHHSRLIAKLASSGVESKAADAQLVAEFFGRAASRGLCSAAAFEDGLAPTAEIIDDIAIDAPKAFELFAQVVRAAGLDEERRARLASKSLDSDRLLLLLS